MDHSIISTFLVISMAFVKGSSISSQPCVPHNFGYSSFVCVCNSTYCDDSFNINDLSDEASAVITISNSELKRFELIYKDFSNNDEDDDKHDYILDETKTFQEILGFGGAFTDAAAINIDKMDPAAAQLILKSYFDKTGLDYSIGRINMGGCDFSIRPYTYVDEVGDVSLDTFALAPEDIDHKIPMVKKANEFRDTPLKLFASPWSAPAWMKSNNNLTGQGYLLEEYYQSWAEYFLRFLQEYEEQGLEFWGLTAQNEPWDGNVPYFGFNSMGWNATTQREWIVNNLGPTLESAGYSDVKLMILDDQRPLIPKWAREVFADEKALKYVSGIGVHWYADDIVPFPFALDQAHDEFPDKFLLYTEACNGMSVGELPWDFDHVMLGSWERAERYLHNIIEDLNHWVVGWTDWNLALDLEGGPNWARNFVDAPIIVDPDNGEFFKQPMFYALGHISRFIPPGSVRIALETGINPVDAVAVKRPDGKIAVVLLNRSNDVTFKIRLHCPKGKLNLDIGPASFTSVLILDN